jgi:hypothetical protein
VPRRCTDIQEMVSACYLCLAEVGTEAPIASTYKDDSKV